MDHRVPLRIHTVLEFDGMPCHVEDVVGCGSNAIVYKGWYWDRLCPEQRHHVLIKELFPFHPAGKIWRSQQGQIVVEPEARELWEAHRKSFLAGNEIHLRLLADHPDLLGANLNSFSRGGTLYSVLGYSGGESLQAELNRLGLSLRRIAQWMLGLLDALEAFHKSGYLHMDISPDNIMLVGNGDNRHIFLIDYNSACPVDMDDRDSMSVKDGYSAPEVETKAISSIGFASDLYSVTAVFFHCLMGRKLTLEERLRAKAPDGSDSPLLKDAPQTVSSMAGQILRKGLNVLPKKRYQSIGQMRLAFRELTDRIDCVGVTHWALWENGRRSVEELIRVNPALRYLKDESALYPIRLEQAGSTTLPRYLADLLAPEGKSGLILAPGGMGKTTLLLHTALLQGKRYSPAAPAVFYISLSGWRGGDTHYITGQILTRLRFRQETNSFDSAMHALLQLLGQGLKTRSGELPTVLLLLDGLNEIRGDMRPLIQEINALGAMAGVRILAASRTGMPAAALETASLAPLETGDIEAALGKRGLLMPRSETLLPLLRTPLILSIYIQASEAGKQLEIRSEEELINAYLEALYQKELQELPENAPQRWQLEAAMRYLLPVIAAEEDRAGCALTDAQLLKTVEKCWKLLRSRKMRRIFPQWIGHSRDILGGAENAEEWYGLMVHGLLWQRLGLLMRQSDGSYRIFHQVIGDYLSGKGKRLSRTILRQRLFSGTTAVAVLALVGLFCLSAVMPNGYDTEQTQQVIDDAVSCYSTYGQRLSELRQLTEYARNDNTADFDFWYAPYEARAEQDAELTDRERSYAAQVDALCQTGEYVAWSKTPIDAEQTKELISDSSQRLACYLEYLPLLQGWVHSQRAREAYPDFPELFDRLLDADARLMSKLYYQSCAPHLAGGEPAWRSNAEKALGAVPESGTEPEERLEYLREEQQLAQNKLAQAASGVRLILKETE